MLRPWKSAALDVADVVAKAFDSFHLHWMHQTCQVSLTRLSTVTCQKSVVKVIHAFVFFLAGIYFRPKR